MLDKALRASNLLSLVDGSRGKPTVTNLNSSGYSAEAIVTTIEADGSKSYIVIAEDDCYKFYAESIIAFKFMLLMINRKGPTLDEVYDSTIMKDARKDAIKIGDMEAPKRVYAYTLHISKIVQDLKLRSRITAWDSSRPHTINMLGWHQHPSGFPNGSHEGSDEVMLALYNLNEVTFKAMVVYPFKVYNFESDQYEYKKKNFMKFIRSERNKNYKIYNQTGFYRSTVDNILEYFFKFDQMQRDPSAYDIERDVLIFVMYYDFMSYVAQRLGSYHKHGKSLQEGKVLITSVINECAHNFQLSNKILRNGMYAIVNKSFPEP